METERIPFAVLATARSSAELDTSAGLSAVELTISDIHREQPRLTTALHLWRVDVPSSDAIATQRNHEYQAGMTPAYTSRLMSIFVVQLADGTYATDGALYDEAKEHSMQEWFNKTRVKVCDVTEPQQHAYQYPWVRMLHVPAVGERFTLWSAGEQTSYVVLQREWHFIIDPQSSFGPEEQTCTLLVRKVENEKEQHP